MKKIKKIALYLLIPALLTACGTPHPYDNPDELGVIYEGENQRVVQVRPLTPEEMATSPSYGASASYLPFYEEYLYNGDIDFAVSGKISNIIEIWIDPQSKDPNHARNLVRAFNYGTLFDFKISSVAHISDTNKNLKPGDTIKIYSGFSSYYNMNSMLYEGDEYLMLVSLVSSLEDEWMSYLSPISEYAIMNPQHNLRKNGDYLEVTDWFDDELEEYDSERISKADAFGVTDRNYIAAGHYWGIEWIDVENIHGIENTGGEFDSREAVLKSPVYAKLYLEYMEENPDFIYTIEDQFDTLTNNKLIDYIDAIPQKLKNMLLEKTLEAYGYTFPDKLEGEYDYKLGLDLEYPDGFDSTNAFRGMTKNTYLYNVEAFENTIRQRAAEYRILGKEAIQKKIDDRLRQEGIIE